MSSKCQALITPSYSFCSPWSFPQTHPAAGWNHNHLRFSSRATTWKWTGNWVSPVLLRTISCLYNQLFPTRTAPGGDMIDVSGLSPSTVWTTPLLRIPVPHPKPHSQPGQAPLLTVDPLRSLQWVPGQLTPQGSWGPSPPLHTSWPGVVQSYLLPHPAEGKTEIRFIFITREGLLTALQ